MSIPFGVTSLVLVLNGVRHVMIYTKCDILGIPRSLCHLLCTYSISMLWCGTVRPYTGHQSLSSLSLCNINPHPSTRYQVHVTGIIYVP